MTDQTPSLPPRALTISGADSSGAFGIQPDLLTFAAFGTMGLSVATTVMAANTVEVAAIAEVPEEVVIAQIDTVAEDIGTDAVKLGILSSKIIVDNVADRLQAWGIPSMVVDPIMFSPNGIPLLQETALWSIIQDILPLATVLICGLVEAEALVGRAITEPSHVRRAISRLHALGATNLVIRGSVGTHQETTLFSNEEQVAELPVEFGERLDLAGIFSAATTAMLARGATLQAALETSSAVINHLKDQTIQPGTGRAFVDHRALAPAVQLAVGAI